MASSFVNRTDPTLDARRGQHRATNPPHPLVDTPPDCPVCRRRLVILSARTRPDAQGVYVRRQLWGCPSGHATASYVNGAFAATELLPFSD